MLIPKRGIRSKSIQFDLVGGMIAHSVLQGGPAFPFLAEWVVDYLLDEDPSNLIISKEYISRSEVTSTFLKLIEELDKAQMPEALNYVLEVHVKHNSFWEVINASEWSSTEVITIENKGCLVHELIFNELVRRRKDQLDSLSRGLQILGFFSLLKRHRKVADHVLCYNALEINAEQFVSFVKSNPSSHAERQAYQWFLDYINNNNNFKFILCNLHDKMIDCTLQCNKLLSKNSHIMNYKTSLRQG